MARTVLCKKFNEELEGLDFPPYPGEKGKEIFLNISKKAWQQWLEHQTRLMNEKRLSPIDPGTKEFLEGEMDKFFSNQSFEQAEGYVPEEKK